MPMISLAFAPSLGIARFIDWDKFLPRVDAFKGQEERSRVANGLA
jgi:hypothetical protein